MKIETIKIDQLPEIESKALEVDEVKPLEFKEEHADQKESMENRNNVVKPIPFTSMVMCYHSCYGGCKGFNSVKK